MIFTSSQPNRKQRLDSWKEIAAFFERDERTVRRWELERGLPVHRVPGTKGRVYAYSNELSDWLAAPRNSEVALTPLQEPTPPEPESASPPIVFIGRRPPAESSSSLSSVQPQPSRPPWKTAGFVLVPIFALAVLTLATLYRSPGLDSIAVLPFTIAGGDTNADYLSDGITESLIDNLARLPRLKVRSRSSVLRYKGKDVDAQKAGNDLGVSAIVSGRVVPRGNNIEVSAELTDARDNTVIWGQHYSGKSTEILSLQQQIAGDIADQLRAKLTPLERQQITRQGTENPEAYELYVRGRHAWDKRTVREVEESISYFNQAIAKDSRYALAYSGLADAYSVMPNFNGEASEYFPKSNAAARKALELDPSLAHPHAVLGVNETQFDWDFAGGEAEFKKALELDPNDATAHQWYAEAIERIGGREQEALAEINRAHQLDPLSPVIARVLGSNLVTAGQYDQGIAVCQKLARDNPTFAIAHDCLAYAYWAKRIYPQVIEEWKTYAQLTGNAEDAEYANALQEGFRSAGWKGAAARAIEYRKGQVKEGHASPVQVADLYADLGDKEKAFRWLNLAYQQHDWLLIGLNSYFQLAPLHSDPRFALLTRKIGLPQ